MALTLMPDGKTFKKLNAAQEKALKGYYNRLHDKPLTETLGMPIGLAVLGGIGALAYIFRDEIKNTFAEQKEELFTWLFSLPKKAAVAAGGGVAGAIIDLEDALFPQNPINPEYIQLDPILNPDGTTTPRPPTGPFSRCQRWGLDANDWLAVAQSYEGDLGYIETTIGALAAARIIKNMKKEDCPRPLAFTVAQWED
jgi:hypothetical protein